MKKLWFFVFLAGILIWGVSSSDFLVPKRSGVCAFCQAPKIADHKVYEGKLASVLATHKPIVRGHLLVIPNRHVEFFDDLTEEELTEMAGLMKRFHVGKQYVVLQKNGILAGQSVPHVHFHLLPRNETVTMVGFIARFLYNPWQKALSDQEIQDSIKELSVELGL